MPKQAALLLALVAQIVAADDGLTEDPYLSFRPHFARSLPVQIMLTGVVLTLVAVLFIHLMFTAQYHWPLAPVNYVLQLSGVTTLLISLIATIHVVLSTTSAESEDWPYMFNYIAINIPPLDQESTTSAWSIAERATWLVMNASTSGLIQITHIQFLTLLYPSRLEARLIFFLLGPLAVVAAIMQLLPISSSESVRDVAGAIRNVCNATLSLLFTVALFIWGLLVNRNQAWRTDGGTAVFGAAALTLALVSTALNLLYVDKEQEYVWLPSLMWAVVLWQSFLGWWWWVGAGSGGGYSTEDDDDVEEKMRREAKKDTRRKEAQQRRRRVWQGVAGAFGSNNSAHDDDERSVRRRRSAERRVRRRRPSTEDEDLEIEQEDRDHPDSSSPRSDTYGTTATRTTHTRTRTSASRTHTNTNTNTNTHTNTRTGTADDTASITSSSGSGTSKESYTTLPRALPDFVHRWYAQIRHAHVVAARQQAAERVERMREIRGDARVGRAGEPSTGAAWGFGWTGFRRRSPSVGEYEMEPYERRRRREETIEEQEEPSSSSLWWWGPLRRWRLRDTTVYR